MSWDYWKKTAALYRKTIHALYCNTYGGLDVDYYSIWIIDEIIFNTGYDNMIMDEKHQLNNSIRSRAIHISTSYYVGHFVFIRSPGKSTIYKT